MNLCFSLNMAKKGYISLFCILEIVLVSEVDILRNPHHIDQGQGQSSLLFPWRPARRLFLYLLGSLKIYVNVINMLDKCTTAGI